MKSRAETKSNGLALVQPPAIEVVAVAKRRQFTAEYKQRILTEIDHCEHGQIGAILRREGLYSSTLTQWRKEQRTALEPRKRGRKADEDAVMRQQLQRLERDNQRLQHRLTQAEKIMEVQKKLSEILGITLPDNDYPETR